MVDRHTEMVITKLGADSIMKTTDNSESGLGKRVVNILGFLMPMTSGILFWIAGLMSIIVKEDSPFISIRTWTFISGSSAICGFFSGIVFLNSESKKGDISRYSLISAFLGLSPFIAILLLLLGILLFRLI